MNKNYSYVLASNRFDALIELNNELNNSFPIMERQKSISILLHGMTPEGFTIRPYRYQNFNIL